MDELLRMTRAGESIMLRELARQATAAMEIDPFVQRGVQMDLFNKAGFVEDLTDPQAN